MKRAKSPAVAPRVAMSVAPSPLAGSPPMWAERSRMTLFFPSRAAAMAAVIPAGVPAHDHHVAGVRAGLRLEGQQQEQAMQQEFHG